MKNKVSLEISDAACGIDCIVLYDNDDRLIKSISSNDVKNMQEAINQHDNLVGQNKKLINSLRNVMNAATHLDYEAYKEFGDDSGEYKENKAITIARNLLKEINGDIDDQQPTN